MIYVRYRWGELSISVSPEPTDDVYCAVGAENIFNKDIGDDLDGELSFKQLKKETKGIIKWPKAQAAEPRD